MTKIMVWNCGDDLDWAKKEVEHLELLRPHCEVTTAPPSLEWEDLAKFSASVKPTIFHFIGHGDSRGQIFVRDGGDVFGRSAADVIRVIRSVSPSLEGVYLSACFSATDGPELLNTLSPAGGWAIGTGLKVDDDLSARFSEKFYQHLVRNAGTPEEAYQVAYAYAVADWGPDEVSHSAWFKPSQLPPVDKMAKKIGDGIRGIFNRPAFRLPMKDDGSIKALEDALQDVSHALGTGQVRSRRYRTVIDPLSFPSEWLQDPEIEQFVRSATSKIAATQKALAVIKAGTQDDMIFGNVLNFDSTATEAEWMKRVNEIDRARNRILRAANELFVRNNVNPLKEIDLSFSQADIQQARARADAGSS